MTYQLIADERYTKKAWKLARWTMAKMDEDGFITGEAARVLDVKYGVDLNYQVDMSLWGMELYARVANDSLVHQYVQKSLENCLYFVLSVNIMVVIYLSNSIFHPSFEETVRIY